MKTGRTGPKQTASTALNRGGQNNETVSFGVSTLPAEHNNDRKPPPRATSHALYVN